MCTALIKSWLGNKKDALQQYYLSHSNLFMPCVLIFVPKELSTLCRQSQDGKGQMKVQRWFFQYQEATAVEAPCCDL